LGLAQKVSNKVVIELREREDKELWGLVSRDLWELAIPNQLYSKIEWKLLIREAVGVRAALRWRETVKLPPKLEWYRTFKKEWCRESYTTVNHLGDASAYAALRTGGNDLNLEMGRWWPKIERPNRKCPLCAKEVEDAVHVLGECRWYSRERSLFVEELIHRLNTDWQVQVIGKTRAGLTVCGARSPSVIAMDDLDWREKVKVWLGDLLSGQISPEDAKIIMECAVPFCRKVIAKRERLLKEGKGNAFAARIISKGVSLANRLVTAYVVTLNL